MASTPNSEGNQDDHADITFLDSTKPNVVYFIAEILVSTFAIPGNLLVLVAFIRVRNLRRYSNYFIISLAIADLLIGVVSIPVCLAISIGLPKDNLYGCLSNLSILRFVLLGSMFSYVLVTFDRWWAIAYPYSYQRKMKTTSFALGICLCSWALAAILAWIQLAGWYSRNGWEAAKHHCFFRQVVDFYYQFFSNVVIVYFAIITMFCMYVYIYRVIKVQQKKMSQASLDNSQQDRHDELSCRIFHMKFHGDALLATRLGKIVFVFMVCQMPLATILCIWAFCPQEICSMWPEWTPCLVVLIHLNAAINPLLYAFHLPDFRMAMKDTLRFIVCRNKMSAMSNL